jgi:hypothetical protein
MLKWQFSLLERMLPSFSPPEEAYLSLSPRQRSFAYPISER